MEVSTRDGGTKEFIGSQPVFRFFQVLSNELATPLVLLCPKDKERIGMTNFTLDFDNSNISYFLGVDATRTNTTMFLSGDRNLENGLPVKRGLLTLTTNVPVSWTRKMHDKSGNVSFPDGSVQPLSTPALRSALAATGVATNRLAMP
jgi:prepilin-type processing-associated H-X9-DG protein